MYGVYHLRRCSNVINCYNAQFMVTLQQCHIVTRRQPWGRIGYVAATFQCDVAATWHCSHEATLRSHWWWYSDIPMRHYCNIMMLLQWSLVVQCTILGMLLQHHLCNASRSCRQCCSNITMRRCSNIAMRHCTLQQHRNMTLQPTL